MLQKSEKKKTRAPPTSVQNPTTAQLSQGTARGCGRSDKPVFLGRQREERVMEGTLEPEGWGLNPRYSYLSLKRMGQGMQSRALQVTLGTGPLCREEPLLPPSHHPEALGAVGRPSAGWLGAGGL